MRGWGNSNFWGRLCGKAKGRNVPRGPDRMTALRKVVITAAGRGTRQYPATNVIQKEMLPIVDVDGLTRPAIQILCQEALHSGIEEIGIVVNPGGDHHLRQHFQPLTSERRDWYRGKEWALRESDQLAAL